MSSKLPKGAMFRNVKQRVLMHKRVLQLRRGFHKVVSLAQQGVSAVRDYVVISRLTSPRTSFEELEVLWSDSAPPKTWGYPEVNLYCGPSAKQGPENTQTARIEIVGNYKEMRQKAQSLGQEKALEYRQSLERERQERFEHLSAFLAEVLQKKVDSNVPIRELLLEICKINLLTWQVAKDGGPDPLRVLQELYPEEVSNEEQTLSPEKAQELYPEEAPNEEQTRSVFSVEVGTLSPEKAQAVVENFSRKRKAEKRTSDD